MSESKPLYRISFADNSRLREAAKKLSPEATADMDLQDRPNLTNDGAMTIMHGAGDNCYPVATVLARIKSKRGEGWKSYDDPERNAMAERIVAALNAGEGK